MNRALPAAVLLGAGIASLVAHLFLFEDPTEPGDWESAAGYVVENMGPRDAFRVHPSWAEEPLVHFTAVGDRRLPQRSPLYEDLHPYERVWVTTPNDRRDEALEALPLPQETTREKTFGTVTALAVPVRGPKILYDFYEQLEEARVVRNQQDGTRPCRRWDEREQRWNCTPPSRWFYVGRSLREVGDEPRECIWAHPLEKGDVLQVEFPDVPVGGTLRVRGGLTLRAARSSRGGPVALRVYVDEDLVGQRIVAHDDHSYPPFDVDMSRWTEPVDVRLEVESLVSARDRFFCVDGWVFEDAGDNDS